MVIISGINSAFPFVAFDLKYFHPPSIYYQIKRISAFYLESQTVLVTLLELYHIYLLMYCSAIS